LQTLTFPASAAPLYRWPLLMCSGLSLGAAAISVLLKLSYTSYTRWPTRQQRRTPASSEARDDDDGKVDL